ncbi:MAG: sulfatase-like hydrolase/transferase, partial [Thermomicrobiales bacterium]|nr:sulfatase-like hydrolase/transferase [Thermomicrobiales bacterium]
IVADDLRADDLAAMPAVRRRLIGEGTRCEQCIAPAPGCAPARASILRGQYPHNHGVLRGSGRFGGFGVFRERGNEAATIATWLQDAGYRTALIGKYLNEYPVGASANHIPPGWNEWAGTTKGGYHGFELNEDGELRRYRKRDGAYQTDVLTAKAIDFVERSTREGAPFFLYLSPRAPHGPATPAARRAGTFSESSAPRPPSFDPADVSGKPGWLQIRPLLDSEQIDAVDATYRVRQETLQSLDEMIAGRDDRGAGGGAGGGRRGRPDLYRLHLGPWLSPGGAPDRRRQGNPLREAIQVPLVVHGPGVPATNTPALASTIDLAPTIAAWAGTDVPKFVDGRSLAPVLETGPDPDDWRAAVLVQHHPQSPGPGRWAAGVQGVAGEWSALRRVCGRVAGAVRSGIGSAPARQSRAGDPSPDPGCAGGGAGRPRQLRWPRRAGGAGGANPA